MIEKRTALVTGGAGFIGSNLVHRLINEGWKVDVVDDMSNGHLELLTGLNMRVLPSGGTFLVDFESYEDDARDDDTVLVIQDDFASPGVLSRIHRGVYDVVFHQAAIPRVLYSVEHPGHTTDINISSTVRLFEACRNNVSRIVFASSSSVYGGADTFPTSELSEKSPKSPYAWQKSTIEDVSKIFGKLYELDIVCLRYFNVFGPGQFGDSPYSTAVSAWCHRTSQMQPLRSDGDGTQSRDLCYVDNVVDANVLAANFDGTFNGKCYNVACGDRTSNNEILEFFKENFSHTLVQEAPWRPGDVMHTQADITKIQQDLGYEAKVDFWAGLERTLEWWGLNKNR